MMNLLDTQGKLKNFSEEQLVAQMQTPSGDVPQFLVLSEIERRKRMRDEAQRQQGMDQTTVAQDVVNAAGVPQGGIADMAQSMAPQTDMTQNTGIMSAAPQKMAGGGVVKMADGSNGPIDRNSYTLPQIISNAFGTYAPRVNARQLSIEIDPVTGRPMREIELEKLAALTGATDLPAPSSDEAKRIAAQAAADRAAVDAAKAANTPPADQNIPGGGGGGGAASSYEQMLMDTLASREKAREQDKWLSLAEVGMAMMASQSPTLAGAFGEAGLKGAASYKKSRDQYDTDRMNIMGELEQYKQQRAAAQARASGSGIKPMTAAQTLQGALNLVKQGQELVDAAGDNADLAGQGQAMMQAGMSMLGMQNTGGATNVTVPQ